MEFNLERARGKKSPVFKKHLVPVASLGNNFIPFVKCGPGVGQGDVRLLHQTEVADPIYVVKCPLFIKVTDKRLKQLK